MILRFIVNEVILRKRLFKRRCFMDSYYYYVFSFNIFRKIIDLGG